MALNSEITDKEKNRLFKLLGPLAKKQSKIRAPNAVEIATAKALLNEGMHPFDAVKILDGQSLAEGAAIVYAALDSLNA